MTALLNPEITRDCKTYLEELLGETFLHKDHRLRILTKNKRIVTRDITLFNRIAQAHEIRLIEDKGELTYHITVPAIDEEVGSHWNVSLNHEQRGSFINNYGGNYTIQ